MAQASGSSEGPSSSRGRTAWQFGPAKLDVALGRLQVGSHFTDLDHSTHGILLCLLRSANQVVLKDTLLEAGWPGRVTTESSLTKAIHRLRAALNDTDGSQIRTVHGYGYQLMLPARCIEVVDDVDETVPAAAPPPTLAEPGRAPLRALALVGLCLLVAVTAAWGWRATHPAPRLAAAMPVAESSVPMAKPSLAVMPFQDVGADKNQQYLGDGMAEEVISLLSKMTTVRVASRRASFRLRDEALSTPEIARRLDVEMILQGSVRRDGDKLWVQAKLVRGADGSTLWTEDFDRKLDDIFVVQREIAVDVLDRLRIQLIGAVPPPRSMNPHAYPLVLEADELANKNTVEGNAAAVALYKKAIALSPREAWAWQGLGRVYSNQANFGEIPRAEGTRLAKMALHRALSIDPDYGFTYANLASVAFTLENDRRTAAKYYEIAMAKSPGEQGIVTSVAVFLQSFGRMDDAIRLHRFALQRDPDSAVILGDLGVDYYFVRKWPEAIDYSRRALSRSPDYVGAHAIIATSMLLSGGDPDEALEEMRAEQNEIFRMSGLPLAFDALDRKVEADAALEQFLRKHGDTQPILVAAIHAERHDVDLAFEWLEKALLANDSYLSYVPIEPLLRNLHDDPRWTPFLRRAGLTPEQLADVQLRVTLPSPTPDMVASQPPK
jgi:TolB-like protein/DNA-binding winged helix-turn-helix (wHTH) protein/Tfp pilus assembly protein PilF